LQHYYEISFRFSRNACTRACVDRFLGIIPEMSRRNDAKHPSLIPLEGRKTLSLSLYSTEREEIVSSRLRRACVAASCSIADTLGNSGQLRGILQLFIVFETAVSDNSRLEEHQTEECRAVKSSEILVKLHFACSRQSFSRKLE